MMKLNTKTKSYLVGDGWIVDIVETDENFVAWISRGEYGHKTFMFAMPKEQQTAENMTLKRFKQCIENTWEDHTDWYEREDNKLEELDDAAETDYVVMENTKPERIGIDGYTFLDGTAKEVEMAKAIRAKFFEYVRENFKTKYTNSVEAFLKWVAATHTESAWWIACEQNDGLYDMFTVLSLFEAWRR